MPDFEVAITDPQPVGGDRATITLDEWLDPEGPGGQPSRVNHRPGHPQLYYHCTQGLLRLEAIVNGVSAPMDAALGGRLFEYSWVEHASVNYPSMTGLASQSSVVDIELPSAGHYTFAMRREGGGAVILHFDVDT